jgi:heme oxygenase
MSDLLARLRAETQDCHQSLENALDIMRPSMQREDYFSLLAGFRGFVAPWEAALVASLPAPMRAFALQREKTALLDDDLRFISDETCVPEQLPQCVIDWPLHTVAQCFGSMYVMEGSTLGGRIIGPAMASRFNLSDRRGYAYFDPYGDRTGSMWNAFKRLATESVQPDDNDQAVWAARATFEALEMWLCAPSRL